MYLRFSLKIRFFPSEKMRQLPMPRQTATLSPNNNTYQGVKLRCRTKMDILEAGIGWPEEGKGHQEREIGDGNSLTDEPSETKPLQ